MKRFSLILLVQFVVVFAAGFFGAWAYSHWFGAPRPAAGGEMTWFQSQLGLSRDKATMLESMQKTFQTEQMRLCEQHCSKRFELAELIKKGGTITPPMETLTREMADLEARSERLTINQIFEIGNQLTADQRTKFYARVYDRICSSCRMDMGKMALGNRASQFSPAQNLHLASDTPNLAPSASD